MKHADLEQKSSASGHFSDMPALLVPGGSRSSLCRMRSASRAADEAAVQWFYCTDVFWNAAKEEWARLTDSDRFEIERNGIATLVDRLRTLYEIAGDEALARINAINLDTNHHRDELEAADRRRGAPSIGANPLSGDAGQSELKAIPPREQS